MSESLMDKKSSLHDILRITEGEDVDIDRVHQHFIDYPYLELWVGKFFSDTSTATVDRERMTERLQAIFDALSSGGDQCTLHTGIGQAIVLDMASADIGKQLVSRAYRDLDIEGDEVVATVQEPAKEEEPVAAPASPAEAVAEEGKTPAPTKTEGAAEPKPDAKAEK